MAVTYVLPIGAWIGIVVVVCLMIVFVIVIMTSNNVTPRPPPPPFNPVDVTTSTPDGVYTPPEPVGDTISMSVQASGSENHVVLAQDPNDPYTLKSSSVNTVVLSPADGIFEFGKSYTIAAPSHIANQTSPDYEQSGPTTGGNNYVTTTTYNDSIPFMSAEVRGSLPTNIRSVMFSRADDQTTLMTIIYVMDLPGDTDEEIQASGIVINVAPEGEPVILKVPTRGEYIEFIEKINSNGYTSQTFVEIIYVAAPPCSS